MKRMISVLSAFAVVLSLLCVTALAAYSSEPSPKSSTGSMSAATANNSITVTVDGTGYYVCGGAESTVGYGYANNYDYVYICQLACNNIYDIYANDIITCPSYCGTVDGIFGQNTYNGILGLQRYSNLTRLVDPWPELAEDGICGDNTWARIADLSF